jgi:hypothetical protein
MDKWKKLKKKLKEDVEYLKSLDFGTAWDESREYDVQYVLELMKKLESE